MGGDALFGYRHPDYRSDHPSNAFLAPFSALLSFTTSHTIEAQLVTSHTPSTLLHRITIINSMSDIKEPGFKVRYDRYHLAAFACLGQKLIRCVD